MNLWVQGHDIWPEASLDEARQSVRKEIILTYIPGHRVQIGENI